MNPELIQELTEAAEYLGTKDNVRVVVLTGSDCGSFCAGGDLKWMRSNFDRTRQQRVRESATLATMLAKLDTLPKLLIGRINGSAFGGGLGLISVCDITIAVDTVDTGQYITLRGGKNWRRERALCSAERQTLKRSPRPRHRTATPRRDQ